MLEYVFVVDHEVAGKFIGGSEYIIPVVTQWTDPGWWRIRSAMPVEAMGLQHMF
jgi:hypothetical protein